MSALVVSGAAGRLGRRVLALLAESPDLTLAGALGRAGGAQLGQDAGLLAGARALGVPLSAEAEPVLQPGRVLIELAPRPAALAHVRLAAERGLPVLVATTGFDRTEEQALRQAAERIPLLLAPNLSLGVAVLLDLAGRAARALPGYHLEIVELHHAKKKDAPSGTAWALARAAAQARGQVAEDDAILARAGEIGPRGEREIGIQAIRGGDIIGEHTLYLVGPTERVELTHRAQTRDVFAAGALSAARFLGAAGRAPGWYAMRDVLSLA